MNRLTDDVLKEYEEWLRTSENGDNHQAFIRLHHHEFSLIIARIRELEADLKSTTLERDVLGDEVNALHDELSELKAEVFTDKFGA